MSTRCDWLREFIADVPDFPKPGILFKDIAPLLNDVDAFRFTIEALADPFIGLEVDAVVGIEARGFLIGAPVAYRLGCGFVPVRKPGKLPGTTVGRDYQLEYGEARLEVQCEALSEGRRVVVVDDVLATGGTAGAALELLGRCGAEVCGAAFLLELEALAGRATLHDTMVQEFMIHTLLNYT